MATLCPLCGKDDAIQRIPAVIDAGRSTGTSAGPSAGLVYVGGKVGLVGGATSQRAVTMTDLARLLVPPPEPRQTGGEGYLLLLIALSVCAMAGLVGVFGRESQSEACYGLPMFIMAVLGLAFFWNRNATTKRQREANYSVEKPIWDTAMQVWLRSYYCYRDGIVFDPETDRVSDPVALKQFLYSFQEGSPAAKNA